MWSACIPRPADIAAGSLKFPPLLFPDCCCRALGPNKAIGISTPATPRCCRPGCSWGAMVVVVGRPCWINSLNQSSSIKPVYGNKINLFSQYIKRTSIAKCATLENVGQLSLDYVRDISSRLVEVNTIDFMTSEKKRR